MTHFWLKCEEPSLRLFLQWIYVLFVGKFQYHLQRDKYRISSQLTSGKSFIYIHIYIYIYNIYIYIYIYAIHIYMYAYIHRITWLTLKAVTQESLNPLQDLFINTVWLSLLSSLCGGTLPNTLAKSKYFPCLNLCNLWGFLLSWRFLSYLLINVGF